MHVRSQDDISMVGDMGIAIPLSAHSLVAVHLTKVRHFSYMNFLTRQTDSDKDECRHAYKVDNVGIFVASIGAD